MTPNLSTAQPRPAFVGRPATCAHVEMFAQVFIHVAKGNRRLSTQGCYSMTD